MNPSIIDRLRYRQHLSKINSLKKQDRDYISYILNRKLDLNDPNILKFVVTAMKENKITDYNLKRLLSNGLSIDNIMSIPDLQNAFLSYCVKDIENTFTSEYESLQETTQELLNNDAWKKFVIDNLSMEELGYTALQNMANRYSFSPLDQKRIELLQLLNYKFEEDKLFQLLTESGSLNKNLIRIFTTNNLMTPTLVDKLYEYKYKILKEWCKTEKEPIPEFDIPELLTPSPDNVFANYWREQSRLLGKDALSFVIKRIKPYSEKHDAFGEKSYSEIYEEWHKENSYLGKKEFYRDIDTNSGRIFDKDGIPTRLMFSRNYELRLLNEVLYYNWEGHKQTIDVDTIDFLVNNIDKIPEEYRCIFIKLKEIMKMEDYRTERSAQLEFLSIITDGHRIQELNQIFNGTELSDRFYEFLFYENGLPKYLDLIAPDWKTKVNANELAFLENYSSILPQNLFYNLYEQEKQRYREEQKPSYEEMEAKYPWLNGRQYVDRYFENGKPNHTLSINILLNTYYRNKLETIPGLYETLTPYEQSYYNFLKEINYSDKIVLTELEIQKYFDEKGPKDEFATYLYEKNEWEIILSANLEYKRILPRKDVLILDEYKSIDDSSLKTVYQNYLKEQKEEIAEDKIKLVAEVLRSISKSNSTEMIQLRSQLATQILATDNPIENLNKIEKIFLKNNIPTVGKIYSVFDILHPNFTGFNMTESSMISPTLKRKGNNGRHIIVFSDLIRASFGSNNRSVLNYLKNLREGNELYLKIKQNPELELTEEEKKTIEEFIAHIETMYHNTLKGKQDETLVLSGNYLEDIEKLKQLLSPDGSLDYNLPDRLVDMFCHFSGITSLEMAEKYIERKIGDANRRNRSRTSITLEKGDFVKGINSFEFLGHILQNGSVSKEYLGAYSSSDATPLDTDISMILNEGGTPEEAMRGTAASGYGNIWFVLKNDDRFTFTRRSAADPIQTTTEKPEITKLEAFYTGVCGEGHYGIRTGFASSEIDAIIVESYDKRIGLEIAMNGFYIPVFDKQGTRVFSPEDYDYLRNKMSGLSFYHAGEYEFAEDLMVPGIEEMAKQLPASREDIIRKRTAILSSVSDVLSKFNLTLKYGFDGDLSEGTAELIDTGSTGRFTNMPGDGDFDFMLKLDRKIIEDPNKLSEIKNALLEAFNKKGSDEVIGTGDFRLKGVQLPELPMTVDIDITFEPKTDKVEYSTDESLKDRLSTIREQDKEKYYLVVSNILLAKKLLKKYEVYKPNRGEVPQGGLGGVGIENWILQNGGSLKKAAETFLAAAEGKSFEEFRNSYVIWDYGENHLVTRKDIYPHDNFTYNMSAEGYEKMKNVLKAYLKSLQEIDEKKIEETSGTITM